MRYQYNIYIYTPYDMIWYDMTWHDMIWYDMIWYTMIHYDWKDIYIYIWYTMIKMLWHTMKMIRYISFRGDSFESKCSAVQRDDTSVAILAQVVAFSVSRIKKVSWAGVAWLMAEEPRRVKEEVATDLRKGGWAGDAIAFFDGMALEDVKKALGEVCSRWGLEDFEDLRKEAKRRRMALDVEDHHASKDPSSGHKDITWKAREGRADLRGREFGLPLEQARPLLPRMIWPTRYQRRLKHCKEDAQRKKLEEDERNRQIGRLVELLRKTGMLKEETMREGASSEWMTRRRAMGRRASTLRAHVRMGMRMREFTTGCLDSDWFKGTGDLMDYIAGRLEEPCGKSIPVSVRFLEASAEVPMDRRLSEDPVLQNFMAEITKSAWWATRTRTSANRLLVAIVICWEFLVVSENEKTYVRIFAWFKLVKLWAMLRWNDTLGIPALRIQYVKKRGLVGDIVRSKTTGVGRRIETQQFYVAEESWLLAEGWLKVGFKLFEDCGKKAGVDKRDFMLPRPDAGLEGFRSSMVRYGDAMAMSRTLLMDLKAPLKSGGEMGPVVLSNETGSFWSEHSERVTMASWAGAVGIQQEVIKRWGRWRAKRGRGVRENQPDPCHESSSRGG